MAEEGEPALAVQANGVCFDWPRREIHHLWPGHATVLPARINDLLFGWKSIPEVVGVGAAAAAGVN